MCESEAWLVVVSATLAVDIVSTLTQYWGHTFVVKRFM